MKFLRTMTEIFRNWSPFLVVTALILVMIYSFNLLNRMGEQEQQQQVAVLLRGPWRVTELDLYQGDHHPAAPGLCASFEVSPANGDDWPHIRIRVVDRHPLYDKIKTVKLDDVVRFSYAAKSDRDWIAQPWLNGLTYEVVPERPSRHGHL